MVSDSVEKPASEARPRYAPRKAKTYDTDKLHQYMVPDLSMQDLLSAIPTQCFRRSTLRSSMYVIIDFAQAAMLFYAASWIDPFTQDMRWSFLSMSEESTRSALQLFSWGCIHFAKALCSQAFGFWHTSADTRHSVRASL